MRKLAIILMLIAASIGYTASEIQIGYKSGSTLYGLVRKHSDSTVWNDSNSAWETWVDAYVGDYNLAMADGDGDFYKVDFPSGIAAGAYPINIYSRQGSDPNNDNDILVGTGEIVWDGSAEVTDYTSYTDRQAILTDTADIQEDWAQAIAQIDNINSDTNDIIVDTNELQTDWTDAGRLDTIIDSTLSYSISSAAWGSINSGTIFRGTVTADDPGVSFTISGLAGQGAGAFIDENTPWYAYVFRDAGGGAAAPQGEVQKVTAYTSATGLFTTDAFTAAVATGDDVMIVSAALINSLAIKTRVELALPSAAPDAAGGLPISDAGGLDLDAILADSNELQVWWADGGRLDLLLDAVVSDSNRVDTDWADGGRLDTILDTVNTTTDDIQNTSGAGGF